VAIEAHIRFLTIKVVLALSGSTDYSLALSWLNLGGTGVVLLNETLNFLVDQLRAECLFFLPIDLVWLRERPFLMLVRQIGRQLVQIRSYALERSDCQIILAVGNFKVGLVALEALLATGSKQTFVSVSGFRFSNFKTFMLNPHARLEQQLHLGGIGPAERSLLGHL